MISVPRLRTRLTGQLIREDGMRYRLGPRRRGEGDSVSWLWRADGMGENDTYMGEDLSVEEINKRLAWGETALNDLIAHLGAFELKRLRFADRYKSRATSMEPLYLILARVVEERGMYLTRL